MGDNWRTRYQIWCHDKACGFEGGIYNSTKKCVEEWNTRPIEDALRAELAAKDAEIARLRGVIEKLETDAAINQIVDNTMKAWGGF